ncbi:MAG: site-2 protease family protein [Thermoplasmata archaeon]
MQEKPENYSNDIEYVQAVVGKKFPIYKTEVEFDIVNLYVNIYGDEEVYKDFDELRREMVPNNFVPFLREENGEYIVSIKKQPERKFRTYKANVVMLIITLTTTLIAGAWQWASYTGSSSFLSLENFANGALFFTLPLLSILGVHEMGHYLTARRHNIQASLPFFIPFSPPLGTIGAFISIREPIPDRKSLLKLGVSGPISGFLVAVPVSLIGIYLGNMMGRGVPSGGSGTFLVINFPLILMFLNNLMPFAADSIMHPTAFAGWVGFLVTGLNLLPAGQLDGGHVVKALFGDYAKYASYAAAGFLVVAGIVWYTGWLFFGFFLLFIVGLKHPPPLNQITELDTKTKVLGVTGILLLFICFHPIPIEQVTYNNNFSLDVHGNDVRNITLNESVNYTFSVENKGKPNSDEYNVSYWMTNETWHGSFFLRNESENSTEWISIEGNKTSVSLDPKENATFRITVTTGGSPSARTDLYLHAKSNRTDKVRVKKLTVNLDYEFGVVSITDKVKTIEGDRAEFELSIENYGRRDAYNVYLSDISNESWTVYFTSGDEFVDNSNLTLFVNTGSNKTFSCIMTAEDSQTRSVRFYVYEGRSDEGVERTRASVVLISAQITIESAGHGSTRTLEIIGAKIPE